ncbi:TPA: replication protein, partial [Acinetobacter baumannii]|nr:replication protein [Acinetobacter baumannii]
MASEEFTFPRNLDNQKLIKTEDGVLPVLHSVPCDIHGIAAVDWVTFSFGQETFGEKYAFLEPEEVDESLTEAIETWLDQILFEI